MKKLLPLIFLLSGGCASIVSGSQQSLSVDTLPVNGSSCKLSNDKGSWFVSPTPGSVTVNRSYSDMQIVCNKGKLSGVSSVKSRTKAMAFGNIIAGGIIGSAVDIGTGAAYDYPSLIKVELK